MEYVCASVCVCVCKGGDEGLISYRGGQWNSDFTATVTSFIPSKWGGVESI